MCKHIVFITVFLIAIIHLTTLHAGNTYGGSRNSYGRRSYYGSQSPLEPANDTPAQTPKEYLNSKAGISTFGIIAIIFTGIVICLVFYYGIMCYPFLCRDEKKYRFMDVSSTITTATSRSIQSIENFSVDQKHERH